MRIEEEQGEYMDNKKATRGTRIEQGEFQNKGAASRTRERHRVELLSNVSTNSKLYNKNVSRVDGNSEGGSLLAFASRETDKESKAAYNIATSDREKPTMYCLKKEGCEKGLETSKYAGLVRACDNSNGTWRLAFNTSLIPFLSLVSVCVVSGMSEDDEDEGRRGNPVPARSLLLSNSTKVAARLNVPIRRTNHYQQ
ncbi:hypothetical protein ANN_24987 [Periplaneta americana]|uniref:Uncharacterized protein n=1 Tax=Periplaneta americana TaxID=6978 RepID=A0ABQ8S0A8_PERAM|nr:hypothetical protein ANN_24987 [Periplaneta americana]